MMLSRIFAKVLNAPNWIGINVLVNNEQLDLFACKSVDSFRRELNMKEGWLSRSFRAILQNDIEVEVNTKRFLSLELDEIGVIQYTITPLNSDANISFQPYLDSGITNEDSNWDDKFWDTLNVSHENHQAFIEAKTMKTDFYTCTFMESKVFINDRPILQKPKINADLNYASYSYDHEVKQHESYTIHKVWRVYCR